MKEARWSRFAKSTLLFLALMLPQAGIAGAGGAGDADYDRLDGHGASGKKVDVIEWENNLEIHVYPAGSLKGLALKLDDHDKNKPVMVIGYRFQDSPSKQLIRRAVIGIPLSAPLKVFKDPSEEEFDKIVISNNGLSSPLALYKLDPEPTQLYPDGHPMLAQQKQQPGSDSGSSSSSGSQDSADRVPASRHKSVKRAESPATIDPDDGTVQPFFTKPESRDVDRPTRLGY